MTNPECPGCWEQTTIRKIAVLCPDGAPAFLQQVLAAKRTHPFWATVERRWNDLYLCPRCQCLFVPDHEVLSLGQMRAHGYVGVSLDVHQPWTIPVSTVSDPLPVAQPAASSFADVIWERYDESELDDYTDHHYW